MKFHLSDRRVRKLFSHLSTVKPTKIKKLIIPAHNHKSKYFKVWLFLFWFLEQLKNICKYNFMHPWKMSGTNGRKTSARSKPNSKLDEDEDDEWLFESIVTYLSSPIWSTPIQHFIEKYCPCNLSFLLLKRV